MVCVFRCPGCSSNMTFNAEKQKLECTACGTEVAVEEYNAAEITLDGGQKCGDDMSSYRCPGCGAEMLTENLQVTCNCSYCGTGMAVFGGGEEKVMPEKVIPFSVTEEQAFNYFCKWWTDHDTMPEFNRNKMKLEMHPMYLPVWLLDANVHTDMSAIVSRMENIDELANIYRNVDRNIMMGSRSAIDRISDKEKVTRRYLIRKAIKSKFNGVPTNASYHFSSTRFQGIEPYDYSKLQDFSAAYLSGYPAEQYSVEMRDVVPKTIKRVLDFGEDQCRTYILGSGVGISEIETDVDVLGTVELREACYALVPVWICSYVFGGKKRMVYVNGQTGKADGDIVVQKDRTKIDYILLLLISVWEYLGILVLGHAFLAPMIGGMSAITGLATGLAVGKYFSGMFFCMLICLALQYVPIKNSGRRRRYTHYSPAELQRMDMYDDIEYRKMDKKDPKKVSIRKFIIGTVLFFAGIIWYASEASAVQKLNPGYTLSAVFPMLLLISVIFGAATTYVFMRNYLQEQTKQEVAEYQDYLKAANTVILESSEQKL